MALKSMSAHDDKPASGFHKFDDDWDFLHLTLIEHMLLRYASYVCRSHSLNLDCKLTTALLLKRTQGRAQCGGTRTRWNSDIGIVGTSYIYWFLFEKMWFQRSDGCSYSPSCWKPTCLEYLHTHNHWRFINIQGLQTGILLYANTRHVCLICVWTDQ